MAADAIATLNTPEWRALPSEEKVRRYYSALELPTHCNPDRIRQRLSREYSAQFRQFKEVIARRTEGDFSEDVYTLKNSSLRFSLLVGALERGEMHAKFLEALDNYAPSPRAILDVGCENGSLTCFYALKWPSARVIGLDPCPEAIARARELAARLRLTNTEFVQGAARDIRRVIGNRGFDLILTVTVLHEAKMFPPDNDLVVMPAACFSPRAITEPITEIAAIADTLAGPRAQWIAAERCHSPATFWWWSRVFDLVGLGIDWPKSDRIMVSGDQEKLTILVASPSAPRPLNPDLALGFWICNEFNRWGGNPAWAVLDCLAEALFARLNPKTCMERIVARDADGGELHRIEVWVSGPLALYYAADKYGKSELQFRALTDLAAMREHWREMASALRKDAPDSVRFEALEAPSP
ncbi:MAG: class I SAM-dependent methyltransferase [Opitutaceae bacterium]|jgi:SAM-dependent methyltransferase